LEKNVFSNAVFTVNGYGYKWIFAAAAADVHSLSTLPISAVNF
jgi:hypothetical protein